MTEEEIAAIKKEITPKKFEDYFTQPELEHIMTQVYQAVLSDLKNGLKEELTPKKGVDYNDGEPGESAETPVKGVHYFTPEEIEGLKKEIIGSIKPVKPAEAPKPLKVDDDFVKQIIKIMHKLPDKEKLEASQGIRNAQSFMYKGTRYETAEMMHGGAASSSATGTFVYNEVVAGSGTTWTLAHVPIANTVTLFANGQYLIPGVDNTIVGAVITTSLSWTAGTVAANYQY
jgi:hypothetical protein